MKKLLAVVLTISVLMGICFTGTIFAEEKTVVIACSDFQPEQGNSAGKPVLEGLIGVLKSEGITSADGFLCCGDYDYEYTETRQGIETVKEAVKSVVDTNMVFAQGNHDSASASDGLSSSGNNDPENGKYGVFVINEDDYMWHNDNEETIKITTQHLINYLNEKITAEYNKPIFVVSHLALNYSMRTKNDGDGMHANYIFDVLNEAGAKGLNIIYLFGHDHSNGWDDYLGGAAIYLEKGDNILIAQNSRTSFREETLNFTYMNAGYVGYYGAVNTGADTTLTMTSFEFDRDEIVISRYDSNGKHNLKSQGVRNSFKNESGYDPDTTVYTSPRTISLTNVTDKTPIEDITDIPDVPVVDPFGEKYIRITSADSLKDGGQYLIVFNAESGSDYIMLPQVKELDRIGFDIEEISVIGGDVLTGDYESKLWKLNKMSDGKWTLEKDGKYAVLKNTSTHKITATLENEATAFDISGNADYFTFCGNDYCLNYNSRGLINGYADPSFFYIYEYQPPVKEIYTRITSADSLRDGGQYLIVFNAQSGSDYIMLPQVRELDRIGFDVEETSAFGTDTVTGNYESKLWKLNKTSDGKWTLEKDGKYAALKNTSTHKITATLENEATAFRIAGNADYFTFCGNEYYFNYNSRGLINGYADPSFFYIYEYQELKDIELKTEKTGSGINCEVVINNIDDEAVIVVAAYLNNGFVCIPLIIDDENDEKEFTLTEQADTLKLFVWNNLEAMKPLIDAQIVDIAE